MPNDYETSKTILNDDNEFDEEDWERNIDCPLCGGHMWFDPRTGEYECEDCQNHAYEGPGGSIYYEHDPDDDYDEYYDVPEGCRACGGHYPECIQGCNLMSD